MGNFKKLEVWQVSHELTIKIYKQTKMFPEYEKFELASQLRRAASSIPTNIAEGSGQLTQINFLRYLGIARGSAYEVNYLLYLAKDLGYISTDTYEELNLMNIRVIKMLQKLINTLKRQ